MLFSLFGSLLCFALRVFANFTWSHCSLCGKHPTKLKHDERHKHKGGIVILGRIPVCIAKAAGTNPNYVNNSYDALLCGQQTNYQIICIDGQYYTFP